MNTSKVKQLRKLLVEFKENMLADEDTFNIDHTIEEVDMWLAETDALRDDKIRGDE